MIIARHLIDQMVNHAREQAPLECCGLIACRGGEAVEVHRATNAARSEVRYEIDGPEQLALMADIAAAGDDLGGIYHSHTRGPAYPSGMDMATAFYPDALYVIVGVAGGASPVVRGFRIIAGMVAEEELESGDSRAHAPPPA